MKDIPKTSSPSSAKRMDDLSVPDYGNSADRITEPGFTSVKQPLGDVPIKVTKEVKYMEYENDKRVTEDFAEKDDDESGSAPLDGITELVLQDDNNRSNINTEFSE